MMETFAKVVLFVAVAFMIMSLVARSMISVNAESMDTYRAWCRVEHRKDVSFPDWQSMKRAGLLRP